MRSQRGFLLLAILLMLPIVLLLVVTLSHSLIQQSGMTLLAAQKSRAFFLAQAGLAQAFQLFSLNNFTAFTHAPDGQRPLDRNHPQFLHCQIPGLQWQGSHYTWSWLPGQPNHLSFSRSGQAESYRFKIYSPQAQSWTIQCQAQVGQAVSQQEWSGSLAPMYDYLVFDAGDSSDFSRPEVNSVKGKIHANGNLFLRPRNTQGFVIHLPNRPDFVLVQPQLPAQLLIDSPQITSASQIIRHKDSTGYPDVGGEVLISHQQGNLGATWMEGLSQGAEGPGQAFDSLHPRWSSTALSKFGGVVRDAQLGVRRQIPPARGTLEPGGYYDARAGLRIEASTQAPFLSEKTFYNQGEGREVTVKELDVAAMMAQQQWPANGLIYSHVPLRLVNAQAFSSRLTLASQSSIYLKGDVNKDNPDGSGPGQSQAVAFLTSDRIYNLTQSFDDNASYRYTDPLNVRQPPPRASDPPLYPGDEVDVLEVNAARSDGNPSNDERAWVDDPHNPYFVSQEFLHPQTHRATGLRRVPDGHDPTAQGLKVAFPGGDDFLENLQGVALQFRGSLSHLRHARMARFDNSDTDEGLTPWVVKSSYLPPQQRNFEHDPRYSDLASGPPLAPMVACKLWWRELR